MTSSLSWKAGIGVLFMAMACSGTAPAADAPGTTALLEMSVNGVAKGAVRVVLRGKDILVLVLALKDAGLIEIPGTPENIGGDLYVRANALGPRIRYAFDEDNLTLNIIADPKLLASNTIDLANAPENIEFVRSTSGFVNYALTTENGERFSFLSEQGLSLGGVFLDNTVSTNFAGRTQRINTSATFDNRQRMTRLVVGDAIANGGVLGGASQIGGISYSKDFSINPYFTPFPGQRFAGVVNTPSTADVYVNGLLVRIVDLPPGPFNLQNLPAVSGAGATRVVIRNAFGLTQELGSPYYLDTRVLRRGLSEFSYSAGVERRPVQTTLGSYGGPAFVGRHRYGLTDTLTLGGFALADKNKVAGGPEATFTLPIGTIGLGAAGSAQSGTSGGAASFQYVYQSARFSLGSMLTYTSPHYATIGLDRNDDRAIYQINAFAGTRIKDVDIALNLYQQEFRDVGKTQQINLTSSTRLANRLNLSLSVFHTEVERLRPATGVFAALTMAIGGDTTATVSANTDSAGTVGTVQLQKSRPLGTGWSYLAQASVGPQAVSVADVQYQGDYGLYELDATHIAGKTNATVSAAGAVTFIGGETFLTRPVQDAYGLIKVPGVAGVTGYISHQDAGKTDRAGSLLVPNLLSYYGNQLGIEPQDIPIDYTVGETERTVAPSYRGGAVVTFAVKKLQAFQGLIKVRRNGADVVPAYGDISVTIADQTIKSPIGGSGEFYLENLQPGDQASVVEFEGETCRFTVSVPRSGERFVQLGTLTCVQSP